MTAPRRVTRELYVGAGPTGPLIAQLSLWGIKSIVNLRYDDEPIILTAANAQTECERFGLEYRHIPVRDRFSITPIEIENFNRAFAELSKPAFVYCRSGYRSAAMWALHELQRQSVDEVIEICFDAGIDLHAIRQTLIDHKAGLNGAERTGSLIADR